MAPEGMENLFVLVPVPHLSPKVDWKRDGEAFKQKVYGMLERRCGIENVRGRIVHETVKTPEDWRDDYNLEEGAAFGIGHGIFQVGYFRPPMVSSNIDNLYFVGASTPSRHGRAAGDHRGAAGGGAHRARGRSEIVRLDPAGGQLLKSNLTLPEKLRALPPGPESPQ